MDDIVRLSVVLHVARSYRRALGALAMAGALLGSTVWFVLAPGWTAASEVLLIGATEQEEIAAEIQIASSLTVLDRTAVALGGGDTGVDLRDRIRVSVVDGSVIAIAATAGTPEAAAQLAETATRTYMEFSAELVGQVAGAATAVLNRRHDDLEQRIEEIRGDISTLQGSPTVTAQSPDGARARAELDRLGDTLTSTTAELQEVDGRVAEAAAGAAAGQGRFAVLESAVPVGAASPTIVQAILGGVVLLPALGLFALLMARHTDRRLWDPQRIGEALGAPVLADPPPAVAVSAEDRPGPRELSALLAVRRPRELVELLRGDEPWTPMAWPATDRPEDPARLHRALDRIPAAADGADAPLLLVPAGDGPALRAAEEMCAGRDPRPRIVEIDIDRPSLEKDLGPADGVAVVSVGTATAWQLVALAATGADSQVTVRGVVAVTRVAQPDPDPEPEPGVGTDDADPADAALAESV